MTFLNLTLLFGTIAALIPLAIYIFNRMRYQTVQWGAMHLLEDIYRENRRRIKIERWLLLLVRMAIPACLALAMARPVLTGSAGLAGEAKSSLVLLLDNSYSMEAGPPTETDFARAQQVATTILDDLPEGSEASVVLPGGKVRTVTEQPTSDLATLKEDVEQLEAGYGRANVVGGLDRAYKVLKNMNYAHRELVVVSDFQTVSWSHEEAQDRLKRVNTIRNELNVNPYVTCIPVGEERSVQNVAVTNLEYSRLALGVGQQVKIRATVKNYGKQEYKDLRLYFLVDGKEQSIAQVTLTPGQEEQVLFTHSFDRPGSHLVKVRTKADPLKADNSMAASLKVWERIPVLLVDGDPSTEPLKGETDFLKLALGPLGATGQVPSGDLIEPKVILPDQLSGKHLSETKVLILANVDQLEEEQLTSIEEFVKRGNGLLLFPGDRIQTDWYNQHFVRDRKLLPMTFGNRLDPESDRKGRILSEVFDHPAMEMFNDPQNGRLSTVRISSWFSLERPKKEEDTGGRTIRILARLNTREPFLVERQGSKGQGRVIQSAVPADSDGSNLPVKPVYVPLMQQLVTYLASEVYPPRNVQVGDALLAVLPGNMAGDTVTVRTPGNQKVDLTVRKRGDRAVARFRDTNRPGAYRILLPGGEQIHYVVSTDRSESDLQQLNPDEITSTVNSMNAELASSASEYTELNHERRFGQEIWQHIALLLLGLLFLEIVLQQYIGGKK